MRKFLISTMFAFVVCNVPSFAFGQSNDMRPLLDKIERLERDLTILQRQVYRGQQVSAPSSGGDSQDSPLTTQLMGRIEQLETESRRLTGALEEANHKNSLLTSRLDRMSKDYELRFNQLEQGGVSATQSQASPPQQAPLPVQNVPANPDKVVLTPPPGMPPQATSAGPGAPPGYLTLPPPGSQAPVLTPPPAPSTMPATTSVQKQISPQDQYQAAYNYVIQGDYAEAETALKAFLAAHPADPLAGNAQYWLAETYYARHDYTQAAAAYAEGYKKYPKSPKAPDSLLKLAMTLANLDRKKDACITISKLEKEYPKMNDAIKRRVSSEKQRLSCGG